MSNRTVRDEDEDDDPYDDLKDRFAAVRDAFHARWALVRPYLPPVNFITVHHAYFIFVGLVASAIFYAVSSHESIPTVKFIDSWFLITSAFTGSGLNTVDLSDLATGQQVMLFIMMIAGSPVLVALFTIWFRLRIFEKRFDHIVEMERERRRRQRATGTMVGMTGVMFGLPVMSSFGTARGNGNGNGRVYHGQGHGNGAEKQISGNNAVRSREHIHFDDDVEANHPPTPATHTHAHGPSLLPTIRQGQQLDDTLLSPIEPPRTPTAPRTPIGRNR